MNRRLLAAVLGQRAHRQQQLLLLQGGRQLERVIEQAVQHAGIDQPRRHDPGMGRRACLERCDHAGHDQLVEADTAAARRVHADVTATMALEHAKEAFEARQGGLDAAEAEGQTKSGDRPAGPALQPHPQRPDQHELTDRQLRDLEIQGFVAQRLVGAQLKRRSHRSLPQSLLKP